MSFDAVSGIGGSGYLPHDVASAVTPACRTEPSPLGTATPQGTRQGTSAAKGTPALSEPATAPASPKREQSVLLVPTIPLSPTVLAELIGRQISLDGPSPGG